MQYDAIPYDKVEYKQLNFINYIARQFYKMSCYDNKKVQGNILYNAVHVV